MKKKILLGVIIVFIITYLVGPSPDSPNIVFKVDDSNFPTKIEQVQAYAERWDSNLELKPRNNSQIYWANDSISKTEYVLVYLHGFSASPEEGAPLHKHIAETYGMNMFAPRLAHHGVVSDEPMLDFTCKDFIEDAYKALKTAELMGEKVIVMSCSTGGTASLYCAAHSDADIHAQILYSPNIRLFDSKSWLLSKNWGLQLARLVKGGNYHEWEVPKDATDYWYGKYRLESLVELQNGLEKLMTEETFKQVTEKTMVCHYYKDPEHQDDVVSVEAIKKMTEQLGVSDDNLHEVNFTKVGAHALQSHFFSQDISSVKKETENYIENILGIKKPF